MADLIIPAVIIAGFVLLIVFSCMRVSGIASREEEERDRRYKSAHPPMDLRMGDDPCDTCLREPECMGVDRPNCPRCNAMKATAETGGDTNDIER